MNTEDVLQATSNVIELKPDKRYLLVFKGDVTMQEIEHMLVLLKREGIRGVGISLSTGQELEVIEAPVGLVDR